MIEDQLELEEREREWLAKHAQRAEEEAQLQEFQDNAYETGDQVNYLFQGWYPEPLRSKRGLRTSKH